MPVVINPAPTNATFLYPKYFNRAPLIIPHQKVQAVLLFTISVMSVAENPSSLNLSLKTSPKQCPNGITIS